EDDVEELIRLYGKHDVGPATESRLLPLADRMRLRARISRYNELRNHPLHSYQEPPAALELAFLKEGWGHATHSLLREDVSPADVMRASHRARLDLQRFALKHRALRLAREQCRLYQQQWQASGPPA